MPCLTFVLHHDSLENRVYHSPLFIVEYLPMLPPVEDAVLRDNPEFTSLYNNLTTSILNPNGSTKTEAASKEREAVREELKARRLETAKRHLLTQAISAAAPTSPAEKPAPARRGLVPKPPSANEQLSAELLDLLLLLPPFLSASHTLSRESAELLLSSPPFSALPSVLPQLAAVVSDNLQASALSLARIANPTTNPSYLHRSIPSIPAQTAALQQAVERGKADVSRARLEASTALVGLVGDETSVLAGLIRALEAKHGTVARSLELRAAGTAQAAQRAEIDSLAALADARRAVYTPDAQAALRAYADHLRDGKMRLNEDIRTLEAELESYGVAVVHGGEEEGDERGGDGGGDEAKERAMREMARVKKEMTKQMKEAKADLARLGKA